MKKNVSIKGLLTLFFCALFFACLLFLAVCGSYFVTAYHGQLLRYNQLTLDLYTGDFLSCIEELEHFNQYIYSEDNDFRTLAARTITSPQRVIAEYDLAASHATAFRPAPSCCFSARKKTCCFIRSEVPWDLWPFHQTALRWCAACGVSCCLRGMRR